jgi:hypothetical protein
MKAKLRKDKDHYRLFVEDKQIGSTGTRVPSKEMYLLSFEKCDEIFGVVDVEELADFYSTMTVFFKKGEIPTEKEIEDAEYISEIAFKAGFNKAMELMEDKVFTLSNLRKAFNSLENHPNRTFTELVALLQPAEIEVEIEMEYIGECNGNDNNGCFQDSPGHNCGCFEYKPKLDSEGCLILKKI